MPMHLNANPAESAEDLAAEEARDLSAMPPSDGLAFTGRATAAMAGFLKGRGLGDWRIYHVTGHRLYDLHRHLDALGESDAVWEQTGELMRGAEGFATLNHDDEGPPPGHPLANLEGEADAADVRPTGCLHLRRHEVVMARWTWFDPTEGRMRGINLYAAPTPGHLSRLRGKLLDLRRKAGASVWQVVRGEPWADGPRRPRDARSAEELVLPDELRKRIERDVVSFFSPDVAALYRDLKVPYRRGVLLHGPPGNGKTSLIRLVGARLPEVPILVLRPAHQFDSDDLQTVIERWTDQAPAVLVIEDLNWLLKEVNVSTFLNLLDGIETVVAPDIDDLGGTTPAGAGGLLLIATTNHPDQLDPAINNRPGRFDVTIEIANPDRALRLEFLRRKLPGIDAAVVEELAVGSSNLSFAHLQELLRQSGLLALSDGRGGRSAEDLRAALKVLRDGSDDAARGFPTKPQVPFGLQHVRKQKRTVLP